MSSTSAPQPAAELTAEDPQREELNIVQCSMTVLTLLKLLNKLLEQFGEAEGDSSSLVRELKTMRLRLRKAGGLRSAIGAMQEIAKIVECVSKTLDGLQLDTESQD